MTECARCHTPDVELWATIEMWSRHGNLRSLDLCQQCTTVAYAFVLNRPLGQEDPIMNFQWSVPLVDDPEDIDDAEHHVLCACVECNPDLGFERRRDEKMERAS